MDIWAFLKIHGAPNKALALQQLRELGGPPPTTGPQSHPCCDTEGCWSRAVQHSFEDHLGPDRHAQGWQSAPGRCTIPKARVGCMPKGLSDTKRFQDQSKTTVPKKSTQNQEVLGQKSCRTKVSRVFRTFVPNFAPIFSRTFRASFRGRRRPEKIHQKNPPFFNAKFPGKHEKNIHKILLESRQSKEVHLNNFPEQFPLGS